MLSLTLFSFLSDPMASSSVLLRPAVGGSSAAASVASTSYREAPALPRLHSRRTLVVANATSGDGKSEGEENDEQASRKGEASIAAAAAAAASLLATAQPAAASEHPLEGGWRHGLRPRRHLRAMGDVVRDRLLRVRNEKKTFVWAGLCLYSPSLSPSLSLSLSPSLSLTLSDTHTHTRAHLSALSPPTPNKTQQDERRAEQNMKDFRNSPRSSRAPSEEPLPEATNVLDAVADDAAAAVESAAAAARSAAASVREWVMGASPKGGGEGEKGELPPAPVRGAGGGDGSYFQVRGEARPLQQQPAPRYRRGPPSSPSPSDASSAITAALALLAAAAAVAAVAGRVSTGAWGPRRGKGRWVRDRGLGGRMVFVAEGGDAPLSSAASSSPSQARKSMNAGLFLDGWEGGGGEGGDPSDVAAARTAAAGGGARSRQAAAAKQQQQQLPSWWSPPRPSPSAAALASTRSGREALARALREDPTLAAAAATLRQLEDSKLAGRDYSPSALAAIRAALGDSGVSLRPSTGSQRDAIFRAAAAAAAEEASGGSSSGGGSSSPSASSPSSSPFSPSPLGGIPPNEFVSGCASDLGVPTAEAVNMSCAAVAARARGLLVDALASRRGGDAAEALLLVGRLAALLSALPLVAGGPQAPMVAEALSQRASLEERRALFEEFLGVVGGSGAVREEGSRERGAAVVAAELLGFDPALVVPS